MKKEYLVKIIKSVLAMVLLGLHGLSFGSSDRQKITFLRQFIKKESLVFDVGANIGDKTALYLQCGARVICIDPQPQCVNTLNKRFKHNHNVRIEPVGLAHCDSVLEMYLCTSSNTISTFSQDWVKFGRFNGLGYKWDGKVEVPVTTLDKMIEKYGIPVFCKIDVENFEHEVLCGLTYKIPCISFEFAAESFSNTKLCVDRLTDIGYSKFNFGYGEHVSFINTQWMSSSDLLAMLADMKQKDTLVWGDVYARCD